MNKETAYRKVRAAIKNGVLVRPDTCRRCGVKPPPASDGRTQIQAHHHDYNKPLDVEWICSKCHRKETPLPSIMGAPVLGERNGQAKLTAEKVMEAKSMRAGGMVYHKIAKHFGVDKMVIMRAIKGIQWAHLNTNGDQDDDRK